MHRNKKAIEVPRDWRKKLNTRNRSRQLLAKGIIQRQNCVFCGHHESKMTHVDYDDPMKVIWLCMKHFLVFQKDKRETVKKEAEISTENMR